MKVAATQTTTAICRQRVAKIKLELFNWYLWFYGDFNPTKPRVNLQGNHLMLLFTLILPCF